MCVCFYQGFKISRGLLFSGCVKQKNLLYKSEKRDKKKLSKFISVSNEFLKYFLKAVKFMKPGLWTCIVSCNMDLYFLKTESLI